MQAHAGGGLDRVCIISLVPFLQGMFPRNALPWNANCREQKKQKEQKGESVARRERGEEMKHCANLAFPGHYRVGLLVWLALLKV